MPEITAAIVDTIAAISTPPGRGGIGIVRLSGPRLLRLPPSSFACASRWNTHGPASPMCSTSESSDERIDEAMVTWFAAPNSYTAEDLVEIAAHGSPVVLDLLLRRALALGARLAEPGEFTQRAFLAGKLRPDAGRGRSRPHRRADAHPGAPGRQPDGRRAQPPRRAHEAVAGRTDRSARSRHRLRRRRRRRHAAVRDRPPHRRARPAAGRARSLICPRPHRPRRTDAGHRGPAQRRQELALQSAR